MVTVELSKGDVAGLVALYVGSLLVATSPELFVGPLEIVNTGFEATIDVLLAGPVVPW